MIIDTILCEWEREYWPISSTQHDGSSHIGTSYNNIIIVKIIVHKGLRGGAWEQGYHTDKLSILHHYICMHVSCHFGELYSSRAYWPIIMCVC